MTPIAKSRPIAAGACVAMLLSSLPLVSSAAVTNATFTVTADVLTTCNVTANNLNFGNYDGTAAGNSNTTLAVTCTLGTPYTVGLNAGTSNAATVTARKMTGPSSELLNYGLFQDASLTTNWGNTIGSDTVAGTGNGVAQTLTVFGHIPAGQFIGPGVFSDTITITLTF